MRKLAFIAALLATVLSTAAALRAQTLGLPDRMQHGPDLVSGGFVALGGRLGEHRIACAQCHGLDGVADASGAVPRLDAQNSWYLYKSLQDFASGLRYNQIMTPVAQQLDDRAMQNVAGYYASLRPQPAESRQPEDVSLLQRGGAISAVGVPGRGIAACQNCHGAEGQGRPPVYPSLAGQYAPYIELQLKRWKSGKRGGDPLNVMREIAVQMSDEDIRAVSVYFASIRRSTAMVQNGLQYQPGAVPEDSMPTGTLPPAAAGTGQ
jgi:cytochrome c553